MFQKTIKESKISILSTIHYPLSTTQSAFTLVELLTVVVIISMLAGMSMLALTSTMTAAKESKTRGTIAKLDAAILDIYESYQERFENNKILNEAEMHNGTAWVDYAGTPLSGSDLTKLKLHLIHDLMRMEMPSYWEEVVTPISDTTRIVYPDTVTTPRFRIKVPPVYTYYSNYATSVRNNPGELLFLIIANLNPEALENFHGSEIGDIDGNGLREFHDAWGRAIYCLRAAPGFVGSDLQPDVVSNAQLPLESEVNLVKYVTNNYWFTPGETSTNATLETEFANAMSQWTDPFESENENDKARQSWFLYPLIVSAGADGAYGIAVGRLIHIDDTYVYPSPSTADHVNPFSFPTGIPVIWTTEGQTTLMHYDNIHNHRSSNSF
jgi:prepilin-type N-terminal cleavage/methylation domain-containing protein